MKDNALKTTASRTFAALALTALLPCSSSAYEWSTAGYGTSHPHPPYPAYIRADRQQTPVGSYQLTWLEKMSTFKTWGVQTYQPIGSGGIKAYPSYKNHIDTRYGKINKLDSKVVMNVPTTPYAQLSYDSSFDIFFRYPDPTDPTKIAARGGKDGINANRYEIMVWLNYLHAAPAGMKVAANVDIDGVRWDIWKAQNIGGNDEVWSLVRVQQTKATYVNLLNIMRHMDAAYSMRMNDLFLITAAFGFEISGTPWRMDFTANEFYLWVGRD